MQKTDALIEPERAGGGEPGRPRRSRGVRLAVWLYRRIRGLLALAMLLVILLIVTPGATWLKAGLDVTQPPQRADYIVCLGGDDARLIWAAELFKQGYAPRVIVSNKDTAATGMKTRIEGMGVPADLILMDSASSTTAHHPDGVAHVPGVDRVAHRFLIVTHCEHSRRAAACFRKGGYRQFTVFAGEASSHLNGEPVIENWRSRTMQLPVLAYEYTALLKYWVLGRI